MKISQLFKTKQQFPDEQVTAVFAEEIQATCKLWIIKDGAEFLILSNSNGQCLPVWSDRHKMINFLEGHNETSWRSMAVPLHMFFTVWWPEVRHLSGNIGINWCGSGDQECVVSGQEFEFLSGRPE